MDWKTSTFFEYPVRLQSSLKTKAEANKLAGYCLLDGSQFDLHPSHMLPNSNFKKMPFKPIKRYEQQICICLKHIGHKTSQQKSSDGHFLNCHSKIRL
jgi:hypothetical protein